MLEKCTAETLQELIELLKWSTQEMKSKVDCSVSSVVSGSELFLRFITLASRLEEGVRNSVLFCFVLNLLRLKQFSTRMVRVVEKIGVVGVVVS